MNSMLAMRRTASLVLSVLLLASWTQPCTCEEVDFWHSYQQFKTEPTFRASVIDVRTNPAPAELAQGYFFLSPFVHDKNDIGWGGLGPQIFDHDGELIWCGNDTARNRVMRVHVCHYLGMSNNHICYHDGPRMAAAHAEGVIRFFDNTYTQVSGDFGAVGGLPRPDAHEMHTPHAMNGTSVLQDVYVPTQMDLTPYAGPKKGWVLDCCFQEVDIRTREALFQWCALDHVPVWDTEVFPESETATNYTSMISGTGSREEPWDFFHINSMDKNAEGDYLVSARHLNAIFKIAGNNNGHGKAPGEIIWRIGGKQSSFKAEFVFSRQHMVRFVATQKDKTIISLLNNAYDGVLETAEYSNGLLLELNNQTMEAKILKLLGMPTKILAGSAGSFQSLANGNFFIGWGSKPWFTEFGPDGTVIFNAIYSGGESPQVWKFPWVGNPQWPPKILTYKRSIRSDDPFYAYMSWNGATEVSAWEVFVSNISANGPWISAGKFPRKGFETQAMLTIPFAMYAYASAMDRTGQVLGSSEAYKTFVPIKSKRKDCDQEGCTVPRFFDFKPTWSATSKRVPLAVLAICFGAIESTNWLVMSFFLRRRGRRRREQRPKGLLELEVKAL